MELLGVTLLREYFCSFVFPQILSRIKSAKFGRSLFSPAKACENCCEQPTARSTWEVTQVVLDSESSPFLKAGHKHLLKLLFRVRNRYSCHRNIKWNIERLWLIRKEVIQGAASEDDISYEVVKLTSVSVILTPPPSFWCSALSTSWSVSNTSGRRESWKNNIALCCPLPLMVLKVLWAISLRSVQTLPILKHETVLD